MRPLSRSWDKAGRTGKAVFSNDPDNSLQIGKYKMQSRPRLHHLSDRVFPRVLPRSEFSLPPHYPRSRPTRSFGNLSVTLSRTCLRIRLSIWARLGTTFRNTFICQLENGDGEKDAAAIGRTNIGAESKQPSRKHLYRRDPEGTKRKGRRLVFDGNERRQRRPVPHPVSLEKV